MKWSWRKIALAFTLSALAIIVVGLGVVQHFLNGDTFRQRLLTLANAHIAGSLTFSRHRVALWLGRVHVEQVELRAADGTLLAAAPTARIDLSYAALLGRVIRLDLVQLNAGYLNLAYDDRDRLRLAELFSSAPASDTAATQADAWAVRVDNIALDNSTLEYSRAAQGHFAYAEAVELRARIDALPGEVDAELAVGRLHWKSPEISGAVVGTLALRGNLYDPDADLSVTFSHAQVATMEVEQLDAALKLRGRRVSLEKISSQGPWGKLNLSGAVDLSPLFPEDFREVNQNAAPTYTLELSVEHLEPVKIPSLAFLGKSRWNLSLKAEGQGLRAGDARCRGEISAVARDLPLEQSPKGTLAANLVWKEKSITVTSSRLELSADSAKANGRIDFDDERFEAQADLSLADLKAAGMLFDIDLPHGRTTALVSAVGSFARPTLSAEIQAQDLRYDSWAAERLSAQAVLDADGVLTVSRLAIQQRGGRVSGGGRLIWRQGKEKWSSDPPLSAHLDLFQLSWEDMGLPTDIQGRATGRLTLGGRLLDPSAELLLAESSVGYDTLEAAVKGRARWQTGRLSVESLKLGRGGSQLEIQGDVDWYDATARAWTDNPRLALQIAATHLVLEEILPPAKGDLTAQLEISGLLDDLAARFNIAPMPGGEWGGEIAGAMKVSGGYTDLEKMDARLNLSRMRVEYRDVLLLAGEDLHAELSKGILVLPSSRLRLLKEGFISLRADGRPDTDLRAALEGRVPLSALSPFDDIFGQVAGEIAFEIQSQGPIKDPQWQARLDGAKVGFAIPGLNQNVSDLNGSLRMGNTELSVERIAGRIDSGRFTMEGSVGLEDWRPVSGRLALQLQAVPLHWPETADFLVGGDLALTGDAQRALLAGRLELLEGLYYKNFRLNLLSAVTQIKRTAPPANGQARPAWMERIALNVDLTHRHPFAVENNIARLSIAPDFKVGGTLAKPQLTGRAQVTEGEIIYRRKSFTVKRGVVDFINPQKIEPALDISAEARIRQYQVTLAVGGTPDQLAFKLDSDPPLSEADILSLVLIGRTNEEIAGGKGGQSSRQMLAALLSTAWGEDIKERTGVDILELSGGEEEQTTVEPNNPDRLQLTVGKRLSRRLTLKYEIDSTPGENIQRAVSEYQFMQNILAKGFQDSRGRYGGELLFRLEFR